MDFAREIDLHPEQSRIAAYRGPPVHNSKILSISIIPHFIMMDRIGCGLISRGMLAASSLVCEVFFLKWPAKIVANTLCSIPKTQNSMFLYSIRILGVFIRGCCKDNSTHYFDIAFFVGWFNKIIKKLELLFPFIEVW